MEHSSLDLRHRLRRKLSAISAFIARLRQALVPASIEGATQRMCPFCGRITPRAQRFCLECGKLMVPAGI